MNKRVALAFLHASVDDINLDPFALKVYLKLVRRCDRRGFTFQSVESIAEDCAIGITKTKSSLKELVEVGLIARVTTPKSKGGSSSKYYILDRDEWLSKDDPDGSSRDPSESDPTGRLATADGSSRDPSLDTEKESPKGNPQKGSGGSKKKTSKRAKWLPESPPLPGDWIDEKFVEEWQAWAEVRPANSLTEAAAKKASKLLADLGSREAAIECLSKSTLNGWRGLFPDRQSAKQPVNPTTPDDWVKQLS